MTAEAPAVADCPFANGHCWHPGPTVADPDTHSEIRHRYCCLCDATDEHRVHRGYSFLWKNE